MIRSVLAVLLLALTLAASPAARAQSPAVPREELEKLVRTLENEAERARLVKELNALIAAQRGGDKKADEGVLGGIADRLSAFNDGVVDGVAALKDAPALISQAAERMRDPMARGRWGEALVKLAGLMLAGMAADRLAAWLLRRPRRVVEPAERVQMLVRLPLGLAAAVLDLIPVAAFAAATHFALSQLSMNGNGRMAALMLITAYASVRAIMVLVRLLAAPGRPTLRLLPVDDETAEYLVIWCRRLTVVGMFGAFAVEAARHLGLPGPAHAFALKSLGLSMAAMLVVFVLQNRLGVARWLRGAKDGTGRMQALRNRLADVWHVLAMLYVGAGYGIWAARVQGGFEFMLRASLMTLVILAAAAAVAAALKKLVERGFALRDETKARFPRLEARVNRYLPVLHGVLRGAVALISAAALTQAWGLDTLGLLASDAGRRVLSAGLTIALVLTAALALWEVVSGSIERYLTAIDGDGNAVERSARARTLLPLARTALMVVLVLMVGLVILSELGVNIAPLLAGAGVVGIAIGFGSQKLVQDVITGAFILFENAIAVGDQVTLGSNSGRVEALSIRAIRLRDSAGSVHTIPFSSVGTVINQSRDFGCAVLEVTADLGEDTERVMQTMREVGTDLQADTKFGAMIVEPLEVWGLDRLEPSAQIIKAAIKTRPNQHAAVRREFNLRLKCAFEQRGIRMPQSGTTIVVGEAPKR